MVALHSAVCKAFRFPHLVQVLLLPLNDSRHLGIEIRLAVLNHTPAKPFGAEERSITVDASWCCQRLISNRIIVFTRSVYIGFILWPTFYEESSGFTTSLGLERYYSIENTHHRHPSSTSVPPIHLLYTAIIATYCQASMQFLS